VAPGGADLFFDEIEVIEQPFPGRRDALLRHDRRRQLVAGLDQHALVRRQARQQLVRYARRRQAVVGRQTDAMQRHLIAAEQLRAQRRFFVACFA
jgi:hypothetical protein